MWSLFVTLIETSIKVYYKTFVTGNNIICTACPTYFWWIMKGVGKCLEGDRNIAAFYVAVILSINIW